MFICLDATKAIIRYTPDAKSLLNRKKLKKEYIFNYLHNDGKTTVNPKSDKDLLITACIERWNLEAVANEQTGMEMMDWSIDAVPSGAASQFAPKGLDHKNIMLESFVKWFFGDFQRGPDLGDFWPDATFRAQISALAGIEASDIAKTGSPSILSLFNYIFFVKKILFSPNYHNFDTDNLSIEADSHGLIRIAISGTVHQKDVCIGIFDQRIGLIEDPRIQSLCGGSTWKIKCIEMMLNLSGPERFEEVLQIE